MADAEGYREHPVLLELSWAVPLPRDGGQSCASAFPMVRGCRGIDHRICANILFRYSSQLLTIVCVPFMSTFQSPHRSPKVQTAVEQRRVDKDLLLRIAIGRVLCSMITIILDWGRGRISRPLNLQIKRHYSGYMFKTMARLDLPTFEDSSIQRQLEQVFTPDSRNSVVWNVVSLAVRLSTTVLRVASQLSVLVAVLRNQRDGPLLAVLSFSQTLISWGTKAPYMPLGDIIL